MSDLLVSILIVNWTTLVLECSRSLTKQGTGPAYEVMVVDNGSVRWPKRESLLTDTRPQ